MHEGPDISIIAALIGNPANANMLLALASGTALTPTELAVEAHLSLQTVSGYLSRLAEARLITVERRGRHRFIRLADPDVASILEALQPVASRAGHLRTRVGPRDPELRKARCCYDHLAGELAVGLLASFLERKLLERKRSNLLVTTAGRRFFGQKDIDIASIEQGRRLPCRRCLDWSERRDHLGGALGAAIFGQIIARGWAVRRSGSRIVAFVTGGEQKIMSWYL